MFELVSNESGKKIYLSPGQVVIGRDSSQCGVVLEEPFISRRQASLEISANGEVVIRDLSGRGSTLLNGHPVSMAPLSDGDTIQFGAGETISFTFRRPRTPAGSAPVRPLHTPAPGFRNSGQVASQRMSSSVMRFDVASSVSIGRSPDNDIVLDAPSVSRRHAQLSYDPSDPQPVLTDLGSSNGTFVNGNILRSPYRLRPSDWVAIGGYLLGVHGREIVTKDLSASRIAAYGVSKSFGDKKVLQDVSVALYPREFIGLMGASGCGKSTLMDVLNGMRPATSGRVFVNDLDLYANFDLLRRSIGYVPQRDILHETLTVERTLYYAAKLRLPAGTPGSRVTEVVDEVIGTVGLSEQRFNAFHQLSGGQQKRLSLGIELITKPSFLFLDEPTSPLDPETTENMMMLFRRLADEGRIVVMVTHKFEKFHEMHNIVLLAKGGRLAFFGSPREALQYFNCEEPSEIYRRLHERSPEELTRLFYESPYFKSNLASRFSEIEAQASRLPAAPAMNQHAGDRKPGLRQWWTLTRRFFEIKLTDLRNTLLLLAQAPIVAVILAFITDSTANDARTIFISAVVSIWLGANNAIREIVAETAVYARERLVNLKIPSYVMSKFAILAGIGAMQCVLFMSIMTAFGRFDWVDFPMLSVILFLTLLAGASIGLFFSALVSSTEKAMSILPLILIPQLLLSGFLKPLDDLYVNIKENKPALVSDYERFEREKDFKFDPMKPDRKPPDPVQKSDGLGAAEPLANLITARWTIDALAHQVSVNDLEARDALAARMTVKEYGKVLDERRETEIVDAYRSRVKFDLSILGMFSIVFLLLTMGALRRKDQL